MAQRSVYNIINPVCVTKNKYIIYKVQDYDSVLRTTTLLNQLPVIRYDNVTLSPLLLPARVTNRSHSTYGSSARSDSHRAVFCPNSVVSGWKN